MQGSSPQLTLASLHRVAVPFTACRPRGGGASMARYISTRRQTTAAATRASLTGAKAVSARIWGRRPWARSPSPWRPSARWLSDESRSPRGHAQAAGRGDRDRLAQGARARGSRAALTRKHASVNAGVVFARAPHAYSRRSRRALPQYETPGPHHASYRDTPARGEHRKRRRPITAGRSERQRGRSEFGVVG